jgi:predicted molibdopterin-dependent oxidoreductase YjgC
VKTASPFLELESGPRVNVTWESETLSLPGGANLAAALLAAGVDVFRRTRVSGAPRAPFCMMGACFECLVEIEGVTRQACMLEVTEGMIITRPHQTGAHDET